MKVLVPGGAGYIGSVLIPMLLSEGHEVIALDNFMYSQSSLNHVCYHPKFSIVKGDLRDKEVLQPLTNWADVVIPLAALVGAPLCKQDPFTATAVNHDATIHLIHSLSPSQRIIMPTTNSAYGTGDENNFCTEESPLNPISQYAQEKVKVEKALMEHPNAISFRLATVFGMSPRMRIDLLVNDFVYRAVHDRAVLLFESHFKRNYIHIRDVCRAFLFGIQHFDEMRGEIYNVGLSDANLSKQELCEKIKEHIPSFTFVDAPIGQDPDQRNYIVSNEKIHQAGFYPQFSLDAGIEELMKGYNMIRNAVYSNV
ncbi:NAD-dependent epimerase/dehydratase family protein [Simkania negevensis]|uniref:NAD-dependent epimerase/dehydratase n=1 Tax=Simkania negevensis (strain ATCC VR-1471 / DSM 27360 / Z) TaxID=331113 RepID=F8L9K7_SIMNZ|nr:SDR family oxidoreductase [Simkania negevensis]MCB1067848.1 SDR family oxidoreductase [Simkania sp.]MCB1074274.1 SDR family oxidoreductase [Simkania sp.]MCP5490610.1 SDR family oxidoreductase [Chlamydiales bacterium]CCB89544.1 NAD-dependent epimerase/dehydratase [Simkania negevensis Z]